MTGDDYTADGGGWVRDGMVPAATWCECPRPQRVQPVRFSRAVALLLRRRFPRDQVICTVRCRGCGEIIEVLAGGLNVDAPSTSGPGPLLQLSDLLVGGHSTDG